MLCTLCAAVGVKRVQPMHRSWAASHDIRKGVKERECRVCTPCLQAVLCVIRYVRVAYVQSLWGELSVTVEVAGGAEKKKEVV